MTYCGGRLFIIPLLRLGDIRLLVAFGFGLSDRFNVGGFGGFSLGMGLRLFSMVSPPPPPPTSVDCLICSGL